MTTLNVLKGKGIFLALAIVSALCLITAGDVRASVSNWAHLHSLTAEAITTGDMDGNGQDDVAVDFGSGYGIYAFMNNASWKFIHDLSPKSFALGNIDSNPGKDLVVDFGQPYGIWIYNSNSTWKLLHAQSADCIVTGDLDGNGKDDIIIDFGDGYGIYAWMNNSSWKWINYASASTMAVGNLDADPKKDLIVDFGQTYGIWIYSNNSAWKQLHSQTAEYIVTGDLDGNGLDDIIIDFGTSYGIYARMNDTSWQFIHGVSPVLMALGNTNSDPKKDLIADFGAQYGIWVFRNNSTWQQLHPVTAKSIVTGNLDNSGKDAIVIDFGSQHGVWIRYSTTPAITITDPQNNAVVNVSPVTVSYTIDIIGKTAEFALTEGSNTLTINDADAAGNTGSASITVTYAPSIMLPSIVTTNGYQLIVSKRKSDNTLEPAAPYIVKGVNWSPASIGSPGANFDEVGMRGEQSKWCDTDIPLIAGMNANTIRTFRDFGVAGDYPVKDWKYILDKCYANNIMVILTVDRCIADEARITAIVNLYKNHPAILMWLIGNEWTINNFYKQKPNIDASAAAVQSAALLIKSLDSNHPVATSIGDPNHPTFEILKDIVKNKCPAVDVWTTNLYRGPNFTNLFDQWRDVGLYYTPKPLVITEFGCDDYNSDTNSEDQVSQRTYEYYQWKDIAANLSAVDAQKTCAGGCVFEFSDEWWKDPGPYYPWDHNTGGYALSGFPDHFASEEWWGLVDIDRNPRASYQLFKEYFGGLTPEPPPTTGSEDMNVVRTSTQPDTITTNLSAYVVSDVFKNASVVKVNDFNAPLDSFYGIQKDITLAQGANDIKIDVTVSGVVTTYHKTVIYDPDYSTAVKKLLYVNDIVIDLDAGACLGRLPAGIVAVTHNGKFALDKDGNVYSTTNNKSTGKKLDFPSLGDDYPVFSENDSIVYSHNAVLDFATNTVLTAQFPVDVVKGTTTFDNSGYIYYGLYAQIRKIDPVTYAVLKSFSDLPYWAYSSCVNKSGTLLFGAAYSSANTMLCILDFNTEIVTQISSLGDYSGDMGESADGAKTLLGTYGNSYYGRGGVYVIDNATKTVGNYYHQFGARRLAVSPEYVFTTSAVVDHFGNGSLIQGSAYHRGLEVLKLNGQAQLEYQKSYFLNLPHDYAAPIWISYKPVSDQS